MRHNDQTTTKPPKIESIKNPLLLVSQGIADFIQVVDDTGLEPNFLLKQGSFYMKSGSF